MASHVMNYAVISYRGKGITVTELKDRLDPKYEGLVFNLDLYLSKTSNLKNSDLLTAYFALLNDQCRKGFVEHSTIPEKLKHFKQVLKTEQILAR